jgi:ABC-2 type transport system ATP-binding protein
MSKVVDVSNLSKKFGDFTAVNNISFTVDTGEIFGLIGPNGAGKTTTLRVLATLLLPSRGYVEILDCDVVKEADKIRPLISYLAEDAGAYKNITGYEYLSIVSRIYYESKSDAQNAVEEAIKLAGLGDRITDKMKNYSKGMKRRIQVSRALMNKPKLAILDEPTSGLDVFHAQHVRRIIKKHVDEGGAVVLSSHNMLEVDHLCSRLSLIHQGKIMIDGSPKSIKEKYGAFNLEDAFMEVINR